ncbi:MAG: ribulose-phosphate 3-epimerase [Nanoarchaeota archaeon]|nr:ribulose-phosphate 3-epimerase [Nanoarchaeota archaeon]
MKIIPSIISHNQKEFNQRFRKVKFAKLIQLDVMDGKFVKNNSLDKNLELPRKNYEAHLMIKKPEEWIATNICFVKSVIFQIESTNQAAQIIKFVRSSGQKIGIALNPETPVSKIKRYIKQIDKVLILTVHPGKYGAKFIPGTLTKIKQIKKLNRKVIVEVDGGINPDTIKLAKKAGADEFVIGSFLQKSRNPKESYKSLIQEIK